MKNVCFFTSDMSWSGGTNKCTAMISNALSETDTKYKVYVLDIHNNEGKIMYPLKANIDYQSLNVTTKQAIIIGLRKYLKKNSIDMIINVEGLLGIYSIPASLFMKTKTIIWEHGNYFLKRYNKVNLVRWLEFKLCDCYVTLTKDDMKEFAKHFKGKCRLKYIYNACETIGLYTEYNALSKSIITVGMNRYDKGFDILVEVARGVHEKHPDWKWNIYGSMEVDKDLNKLLYQKVKEYRLESFLIFHGLKTEMIPLYKESGIMVMTSRREGLPMVLLEAMGCGIPMVAFDIKTGPNEIIDNDFNGYLIKPYDIEEMINKICRLIENKELRVKFSRQTQTGIEKFDIRKIVLEWDGLLEAM